MKKFFLLSIVVAISICKVVAQSVNNHEYVDLGLPSGTLWATCNVGAAYPPAYGGYYTWSNSAYAASSWGEPWEMMTKNDRDELVRYCRYSEEYLSGVRGVRYTGPNGNSIFLPFCGYTQQGTHVYGLGVGGQYWTSTSYNDNCYWVLNIESRYQEDNAANYWPLWYFGFPLRLVIHNTRKCAMPEISFWNGKLIFYSATSGVQYHSNITVSDAGLHDGAIINLDATYEISVYATCYGYKPSETATALLCWVDGNLISDGIASTFAAKRPVLISSRNGLLTISGLEEGETASVYTTDGKLLGTTADSLVVSGNQMVIVKIGNETIKTMVK